MTPHSPGGVNGKASRRQRGPPHLATGLFLFIGARPGHNASVVVQCQSCQARFRVADEKVTDRGVRVRCTSCKTIFLVKKDGVVATSQATTGETVMGMAPISLVPPQRQPGPAAGVRLSTPPVQKSAPPAPRPSAPPAARNGAPKRPLDDLFGMAELTGEAPSAPPPAPVPFPASRPPPAGPPRAKVPPPQPAAPALRPRPKAPPLELDLDIGGPATPRPPTTRPPPAKSLPPSPRKLDSPLPIGKLQRPPEPFGEPTDDSPVPSIPPPPPSVFEDAESAAPAAAVSAPPPPPGPARSDRPDLRDPFDGMDLGAEGEGNPPPLRASDPALAKVPAAPPAPSTSEGADHEPGQSSPFPEGDGEQASVLPPPARLARRHLVASGLTGIIGAGLALALALATGALSEGTLPRLFGAGGHDLVAVTEASGLYDTSSGKPVYFVRGRVENRGKKVTGPVRVLALLLSANGPVARAESIAGVDASPEDVYALRSSAEAEKLVKSLAQKNPTDRRLPPGGSLPFFALFADPPQDLAGERVQVRLEVP